VFFEVFVGNLYFITFTMLFLALAGKMATFKKNMAIFAQNDLVTLLETTFMIRFASKTFQIHRYDVDTSIFVRKLKSENC